MPSGSSAASAPSGPASPSRSGRARRRRAGPGSAARRRPRGRGRSGRRAGGCARRRGRRRCRALRRHGAGLSLGSAARGRAGVARDGPAGDLPRAPPRRNTRRTAARERAPRGRSRACAALSGRHPAHHEPIASTAGWILAAGAVADGRRARRGRRGLLARLADDVVQVALDERGRVGVVVGRAGHRVRGQHVRVDALARRVALEVVGEDVLAGGVVLGDSSRTLAAASAVGFW